MKQGSKDSNSTNNLQKDLIAEKQKNPYEWDRFLKRGRALNELFNKLQAI